MTNRDLIKILQEHPDTANVVAMSDSCCYWGYDACYKIDVQISYDANKNVILISGDGDEY